MASSSSLTSITYLLLGILTSKPSIIYGQGCFEHCNECYTQKTCRARGNACYWNVEACEPTPTTTATATTTTTTITEEISGGQLKYQVIPMETTREGEACICTEEYFELGHNPKSCACNNGLKSIFVQYLGNVDAGTLTFFYENSAPYQHCVFSNIKPNEIVQCTSYPYAKFNTDIQVTVTYVGGGGCISSIHTSCTGNILNTQPIGGCGTLEIVGWVDYDNYICKSSASTSISTTTTTTQTLEEDPPMQSWTTSKPWSSPNSMSTTSSSSSSSSNKSSKKSSKSSSASKGSGGGRRRRLRYESQTQRGEKISSHGGGLEYTRRVNRRLVEEDKPWTYSSSGQKDKTKTKSTKKPKQSKTPKTKPSKTPKEKKWGSHSQETTPQTTKVWTTTTTATNTWPMDQPWSMPHESTKATEEGYDTTTTTTGTYTNTLFEAYCDCSDASSWDDVYYYEGPGDIVQMDTNGNPIPAQINNAVSDGYNMIINSNDSKRFGNHTIVISMVLAIFSISCLMFI